MTRKVALPIEKICKLERWDPSGEETVTVRQATQGTVDKLENFRTSNNEYVWNDQEQGTTVMRSKRGVAEIRKLQVRETLIACTLLDDKSGQPLFKTFRFQSDTDVVSFDKAWESLPPELGQEIYEKVLEVNPQWAPLGEAL